MRNFLQKKPLIIILISTLVCLAISVIAIVLVNSTDYGIKSVTVNGVSATITNRDINVKIQESEILNITIITNDKAAEYAVYADKDKTERIKNLSAISTNGEDVTYYVTTGKSGKIKENYLLHIYFIKAQVPNIIELKINNYVADVYQNSCEVKLPRVSLYRLDITVSQYASFSVYYDSEKKRAVQDINNIKELNSTGSESYLYVFVKTQSGNEKLYTVTLKYILDDNVSVASIYVNGITAQITDNFAVVLLERSNSLSITTDCSAKTTFIKYYFDDTCLSEISNNENIDISGFYGKKYQLYIKAIAESGDFALYTLTITFIPYQESEILDLQINNKSIVFSNLTAILEFEGTPNNFILDIQHLKISPYASYNVYYDLGCTVEINNEHGIVLANAEQSVYIKVTAENEELFSIYCLNIHLISNDNTIKSITFNGQEHLVKSEYSEVSIESTSIISIDNISLDDTATVFIYYDSAQTKPITNLNNIEFTNHSSHLYFRVVAENQEIKVYHILVIVKYAPEINFPTGTVRLSERQTMIPIIDLIQIDGKSYTPNQYATEISWDGVIQNTDNISVNNIEKIYTISVKITSRYFKAINAEKSIKVLPYTLMPVSAQIIKNDIEIKDSAQIFKLADILNIDEGSYRLGTDFYIELNNSINTKIILNQDMPFSFNIGVTDIFINSFRNEFESIYIGKINVSVISKVKPQITAQPYLEFDINESTIAVKDLFTIINNDYEINLIKTFIDNREATAISCAIAGTYILKLQAYYSDGVVELEIELCITDKSDNTNISVTVNNNSVVFTDLSATLDSIPYDGEFNIEVNAQSAKTVVSILLNGIEITDGGLSLTEGQNVIEIRAVAESGNETIYFIYVTKNARKLPEIKAENITIQLSKYQTEIDLSGLFEIIENDYTGTCTILYNNVALANPSLTVPNKDAIYNITVRYEGEFGVIEKTFSIGIVQFNEIEIIFTNSLINQPNPDYSFALNDFIASLNFYGIDQDSCIIKLFCNNEPFTAGTLPSDTYYITLQIWLSSGLIKEESNWFTISHSEPKKTISVKLKSDAVNIRTKRVYPNVDDYFNIDYAGYDIKLLRFSFIYENTDFAPNKFTLQHGINHFTLLINNVITGEELYSGTFTIICDYIPYSSAVFNRISINGSEARIENDLIKIINKKPVDAINIEFTVNDSFSVKNMQKDLIIRHGVNIIEYTAIENGYEFSGILTIYNVCDFGYYLNDVYYDGVKRENNKIILDENAVFDVDKIYLDINNTNISARITVTSKREDVYDVVITGYYDNIEIGYTYVQIFIGIEPPRLIDIISIIGADGLKHYSINEYSIVIYIISDNTDLPIYITYNDSIYSSNIIINDLQIGQNTTTFFITTTDTVLYYDMNLWVFPTNTVQSVFYNQKELTYTDNKIYICEDAAFNKDNAIIMLDPNTKDIDFNKNWTTTEYNGITVGGTYHLILNNIEIFNVELALSNSNVSVEIKRFTENLTQSGDAKFVDTVEIEKDFSSALEYIYIINAIYPYTKIQGNDLEYVTDVGYILTIDLSKYLHSPIGIYNITHSFKANALNAEKEYMLNIEIKVFERNADNAALIITVNDNQEIYLLENELNSNTINVAQNLNLDIFTLNAEIALESDNSYYIFDGTNPIKKANVARKYNNSYYYIEFSIGISFANLKTVRIKIADFTTTTGIIIDTAGLINDTPFYILENAPTRTIQYNNQYYEVFLSSAPLNVPQGTTKLSVSLFGYLLEYGSFVFDDNIGNEGSLTITDNSIVLLYKEGDNIIPYAIIDIQYT